MTASKRFLISINLDIELTVEELWPSKDAPENPTVEDVKRLIQSEGGPLEIVRDWNLDSNLECSISSDGKKISILGRR